MSREKQNPMTGNTKAKWLFAALVMILAAFVLVEISLSESQSSAESGRQERQQGLFAVSGQLDDDTYGVFLVDPQNDTICVYQFLPGTRRKLRLVAARNFTYDVRLDEYNTEPSPREIKKLVEQHKRIDEGETAP